MLIKLVRSLEHQSIDRSKYEILICDSSSNDGTFEAVLEMQNKYKNIKYYNIETNTLVAKRNFLYKKTKNSIIITLDDDLIVSGDFIGSHLQAHSDTEKTIFCGQVRFPPEWITSSNYYRYRDSRHIGIHSVGLNLQDLPAKYIVVMNMSLKKAEVDKCGFMDENFIKYGGEDQEFGLRVKQSGIKISYLEKALVYHYESSDIQGYMRKQYCAARFGGKKLNEIRPDNINSTICRYLYPLRRSDNFALLIGKLFLLPLLNSVFKNLCLLFVKATDRYEWLYSPTVFKFLVAYSIKCGYFDQNKEDNSDKWI